MSFAIHKKIVFNNHKHGGNLARVRRTLAMILEGAHRVPRPEAIIVFGYPGSGKSSLIESALSDVVQATYS
jgi:putative protein kinase ArgK-like GTPase of G3E family